MNWNLRDSLSGSGKGADADKGGDVGEFVGNSKQDFLRFHELTIRNAYQEQMTSLNMVFCEGESYLLCSLDHTGRSFTELFHGNSHVISGYIFGADGTAQNGTGDFFYRQRIYYVDSHVQFMDSLNLAENVFLLKSNSLKKVRLNRKAVLLRTKELFLRYGLPFEPEQTVGSLRVIDKVLLQLVRLADRHPRMLVISNLSFICNEEDLERLLEILKKLRNEGISLLMYDSVPERFIALADEILLIKKGEIVRKFYEKSIFENYWKRSAKSIQKGREKGEFSREDTTEFYRFSWQFPSGVPCSFEIHPGEILYFPTDGWEHQQMVCRGMMGLLEQGMSFETKEKRIQCKNPDMLQKYRIFFWGEERIEDELFPNMSITDNILMPSVKRISRMGFYRSGEKFIFRDMDFSEVTEGFGETGSLTDEAVFKLLCYRWKLYHPRVLVAYNVLSRFDPEMKQWMADQILQMAQRGTAFILLESVGEAAGNIADRVIHTPWREEGKL